MRRCRLLLIPILMLLTISVAGAQGIQAKMNAYMQASMKFDHFMGSVLVAQHGKIILSKGYGMANKALGIPNTPDTEFRIGSNTKQFTAMAILQLVASGKLAVQNPVCEYVRNCPKDWAPITVYELLTHTSGIPNFTSFPNYMEVQSHFITPTGLLALFENKPLNFKPGTKFEYSNSGYEVLGYIIQRVSGESYQEYLHKHIFGPLELKDSGYDKSHPTDKDHAQGYDYTPGGYKPAQYVNMTVPFSAGALYSTVRDLYKWDLALHAGKLLPAKLQDQMFTPRIAMGGPGSRQHAFQYAFGWIISTEFGHKEISHSGGIQGFTSVNSWFPGQDAYVIVLDNTTSPQVAAVSRSLTAILFGQKYAIPREYQAIRLPADALQRFVGQYQLRPGFILTIRRAGDHLEAQAMAQDAVPIYPASKSEFFSRVVDVQMTFVNDAGGQVTGLVLHQGGRDMPAKKLSR
jgi:CubicO group peptidase (beta-lactamase class C family)